MSTGSEELEDDVGSELGGSTDLGSLAPTREDDLTVDGTSTTQYGQQERDGLLSTPAVMLAHEYQGGEEVAVAMPPTESDGAGEYHEIALTGSAALDLLDQLAANNAIGKEKAAKLRRKYNALRDTLESSRVMESNLLDKAKMLSHQLAYQRRVLEKGASFPDSSTTHASHLRQILLSHQNELDMCDTRISKLDQEAEKLTLEQGLVEKEYQRLPKKEELELHIKELTKSVEGLNDEISMRSQDVERYHGDLDKKNFRMTVIQNEIEELRQLEEALQQELIALRNGPNITKEIEIIKRQHKETLQTIKETDDDVDKITAEIAEIESRTARMKEDCTSTAMQLQKQHGFATEKHMEMKDLTGHVIQCKDREASLLVDKATLEMRQKHRSVEARSLYEEHVAKVLEKDQKLKALKKADLQVSALRQSTEQLNRQKVNIEERAKQQLHECERREAATVAVQAQVHALRKKLQHIDGVSDYDRVKLNQKQAAEDSAKRCVKELKEKLRDLNRDILAMTKARDNESRLYYRARKEYRAITSDIETKESYIKDHQKKMREVGAELLDFVAAYKMVKNERNKAHAQIIEMKEIKEQLTEKTKIVANEMEILRTIAGEKEKLLQQCSLVHSAKVMERDTQRQELNEVKVGLEEEIIEKEHVEKRLANLAAQIRFFNHLLTTLRGQYERSVQERNDLGLQYIGLYDELCVFYEKLNVQKSVIRTGNLRMEEKEEELRLLSDELQRLRGEMFLYQKKLPEKSQASLELRAAQAELEACRGKVKQLEKAVEDAHDPSRIRLLPGDNPNHNELTDKINRVEVRLAESEQQLLEKELLYEQVGKLTDRAKKKVESQRLSTLAVAKKVNNYQAKIKAVTRKMMALVSELSMQQASSLHLEQEAKEQESRLQQAYTRVENGEAPDEQTQEEWEKMIRDEYRRRQAALEKMAERDAEMSHALPNGVVTSAVPRPTAYVPLGEGDLPLPKPYGKHAPFKPSQSVGNLRHIRKPQPQPIDI